MACLKHLNTVISKKVVGGIGGSSKRKDSNFNPFPHKIASSSALLECEDVLPMNTDEVAHVAAILHITAALCEFMSEKVLSQSHLPSLLAACRDIARTRDA